MARFRPWYLLVPAVSLLAFIDFAPFFYGIYLSFQRWIMISPAPLVYIGFDNYGFLVNDSEFLNAFVRGVTFAAISIACQLLLGLGTAFIMLRKFKGNVAFKVILTLPLAVAPIAVGSMWRIIMYPGLGPIPYYLKEFFGITWNMTVNSTVAFATVVMMDTWHWLPLAALILLSGIASIPQPLLESASIDGGTTLQKLRFIYLPLIKFEVLFVVLLRGMDAFRIFDEIWMLTGGGPGDTTRFLSISLYTLILRAWDIGYGAAISLVYLYVIIVMCWILYQAVMRVRD